ncbi:beta propeller repeat protein [Tellurirhabdus rosea]|uniref:oxidoreductase n=1 Tax=Tellurirhabdus rosea TaxID=2674997 RepID=UPI002253FCFD|nr:oxidoreductase [Tellurirhabdus rosea]
MNLFRAFGCLSFFLLFSSAPLLAQWQPQQSGTTASFRAVSAASRNVVWVGGTRGTFVRTTDGGQTWQAGRVPGADSLDFRDVYAVNANMAYLMSAGPAERGQARIYKTTDGGQTWNLMYETRQKGVFFDSMDFYNRREGMLFSDPIDGKWVVLRTTNGGQTWKPIRPDRLPPVKPGEAAFAASGSSLIFHGMDSQHSHTRFARIASGGADTARVFYTQNNILRRWKVSNTPIPAGPTAGIFGLWFDRMGRRGMAVGGDYKAEKASSQNVAVTRNGGRTWEAATPTNPPGLKEGIGNIRGRRLVLVGPSGSCYTDDWGKTWTKIDDSAYHAISCTGGQCWAVGAGGKIGFLRQ